MDSTNLTTVDLSGTDLITQDGLDSTWVDFDLSVEDAGEVFGRRGAGVVSGGDVGSGKDGSVEDFDLIFGNGWPRYVVRGRKALHDPQPSWWWRDQQR